MDIRCLMTSALICLVGGQWAAAEHDFNNQWTAKSPGNPYWLEYSRDGTLVHGVCSDGVWRSWDYQTGVLKAEWGRAAYRFGISPDELMLAAGDLSGKVFLFDTVGSKAYPLTGHAGHPRRIQFTPDGDYLVIGSVDGLIRIWSSEGEVVAEIGPIEGGLQDVCLTRAGDRMATTGPDGFLRFYSVPSGELITEHQLERGTIRGLDFSPDDKRLAIGGTNTEVLLWNVEQEKIMASRAVEGFPYLVEFSPNGTTLAVGTHSYSPENTGSIYVWETDRGAGIERLPDFTTGIDGLAWHPSGAWLATSDTTGQVRVWRRATTKPVEFETGPAESATEAWRNGALAKLTPEYAPPLSLRAARNDEVPENYTAIEVNQGDLQRLSVEGIPPYLQDSFIYRLNSPAGTPDDGVLEFTVGRSGRLFLAASWVYSRNIPQDVKNEITSENELIQSGWIRLQGHLPWASGHRLFVRYCQAGETFRIRTSDRRFPMPILAPPVDLRSDDIVADVSAEEQRALLRAYISELRSRKDIDALEELAGELRETQSKSRDGFSDLHSLYTTLATQGVGRLDPEWFARLQFLEGWIDDRPDSPTPLIAAGMLMQEYGWQARGNALAANVSDRQWKLFRDRLAEARYYVNDAEALVDNDPAIYYVKLMCAWGLADEVDRVEVYALRSLEVDPTYIEAVRAMAYFLLPQWHGRPGRLHEFGMKAVAETRDRCGAAMYLHLRDALSNSRDYFLIKEEFQWKMIRQAYRDLLERFPEAAHRRVDFIRDARLAGDRDAAEEAFAGVGDSFVASGFRDEKDFDYYRVALNAQVRDGDQKMLVDDLTESIRVLDFSQNDRRLVALQGTSTISVWHAATGKPAEEPYKLQGLINHIALGGGNTMIVGASSGDVVLREVDDDPLAEEFRVGKHQKPIVSLQLCREAGVYLSASQDGVIRIWHGETGVQKKQLNASHGKNLAAATISNDGATVATTGDDGQVVLWNADNGLKLRDWPTGDGPGLSLAFSPDGRLLAVGHGDANVTIWRVDSQQQLATAVLNDAGPHRLAFSPDGALLAVGCRSGPSYPNGGAYLWRFGSNEPQRLNGHDCGVLALTFAHNKPLLATGGTDWTIRLWEVKESYR